MVRFHMRVPSQGHGLLRSESLFAHTPPELRCAKIIRRTGQRCKNIRVRGANCCRMHGGGTVAVKRYREEVAAICAYKRGGRPRAGRLEWLLQRIARADRNRPRKHNPNYERVNAAEAERLMREVSENGATALARAVHAAAVSLRPYRQVDCLIASARLALAWGGTRHDAERVMLVQEMASWLGVDTEERMRLGELLVPILGYRAV